MRLPIRPSQLVLTPVIFLLSGCFQLPFLHPTHSPAAQSSSNGSSSGITSNPTGNTGGNVSSSTSNSNGSDGSGGSGAGGSGGSDGSVSVVGPLMKVSFAYLDVRGQKVIQNIANGESTFIHNYPGSLTAVSTISISNIGDADLKTTVSASGDFTVSPTGALVIGAGQSVSLSVAYPKAVGLYHGQLKLQSNDPNDANFAFSVYGSVYDRVASQNSQNSPKTFTTTYGVPIRLDLPDFDPTQGYPSGSPYGFVHGRVPNLVFVPAIAGYKTTVDNTFYNEKATYLQNQQDLDYAWIQFSVQGIYALPYNQATAPQEAVNSSISVDEDAPSITGQLRTNGASANVTYLLISNGLNKGSALIDPHTGQFTYYPNHDRFGADVFYFQVRDNGVLSNVAKVDVTINRKDVSFPIDDLTATTSRNISVGVDLRRFAESGEETVSYTVIRGPEHGTLSGSSPIFQYTPNKGWIGNDSMILQAKSPVSTSNLFVVTLAVKDFTPICSAQDLANIAKNLSGDYILTCDVDLSNFSWTALGDWNQNTALSHIPPFSGILEGNGHAISGLKGAAGLFVESDGIIRNLRLTNLNLQMDMNFAGQNRGAIAGILGVATGPGVISNCSVSGNIKATKLMNLGGLVGLNVGGKIFDSSASLQLQVGGGWEVGGLVGLNEGVISHGTSSGSFSQLDVGNLCKDVGGLVGEQLVFDDPINHSFRYSLIEFSSSSMSLDTGHPGGDPSYDIGGLVGLMSGSFGDQGSELSSVLNSSASGNVSGETTIGGLIGWAQDSSEVVQSKASGSVAGGMILGGLAGEVQGSLLSRDSAFGSVTYDNKRANPSSVLAGGLVGMAVENVHIDRSVATGRVDTTQFAGGIDVSGGLVGEFECDGVWAGTSQILNSYATGEVAGHSSLIGGAVGGTWTRSWCPAEIINTYSTGRVSASAGGTAGGFSGGNNDVGITYVDSYWDVDTSGQASSVGGTGVSDAQMHSQATFVGWDFDQIWAMSGLPILRN